LLDVDLFKKYNDNYRHQPGDEWLRRVASVLANTLCRTGEFAARYGGGDGIPAAAKRLADALRFMGRGVDTVRIIETMKRAKHHAREANPSKFVCLHWGIA